MRTRKTDTGGREVIGRGHSRGVPETTEFGKMVARMMRAWGKRVADADEVDLAQMLKARDEFDRSIVLAVYGMRTKWGRSWAYIAEGAGITRQAAQQRWGKAVERLAQELAESNEFTQCSWNRGPDPASGCDAEATGDDGLCDKHRRALATLTHDDFPADHDQLACTRCNPTGDRAAGRCLDCDRLALRPGPGRPFVIKHALMCKYNVIDQDDTEANVQVALGNLTGTEAAMLNAQET